MCNFANCGLFAMLFLIGGLALSSLFVKPMNYVCFLVALSFGETLIFMFISPKVMAIMNCVPAHLRGQANAISGLFMHALGGFPAPSVTGAFVPELRILFRNDIFIFLDPHQYHILGHWI